MSCFRCCFGSSDTADARNAARSLGSTPAFHHGQQQPQQQLYDGVYGGYGTAGTPPKPARVSSGARHDLKVGDSAREDPSSQASAQQPDSLSAQQHDSLLRLQHQPIQQQLLQSGSSPVPPRVVVTSAHRTESGKKSSRKDLRRNASKVSERAERLDRSERMERGFSSHGPLAFVRSASSGKGAGFGGDAGMNGEHGAGYGTGTGGVIIDIAATHNTFHESTDGREQTDNNGLSRGQNFLKVEKWLREASRHQLVDITPRVIRNIEDPESPPLADVGEPPTELDRLPPMMPTAQSQLSVMQ